MPLIFLCCCRAKEGEDGALMGARRGMMSEGRGMLKISARHARQRAMMLPHFRAHAGERDDESDSCAAMSFLGAAARARCQPMPDAREDFDEMLSSSADMLCWPMREGKAYEGMRVARL